MKRRRQARVRATDGRRVDRVQLTQVEKLEADHPGLQFYVDLSFDRGVNAAEISRGVHQKYGVSISERVLYSYRRRRWKVTRDAIRDGIRHLREIIAIMHELPERDLRRARIYEHILEMTLPQLCERDVEATGLESQERKLDIEDKRADNEGKALLAKTKETSASRGRGGKKKADGDEKADPAEIRRRIRGIFGLPDDRSSETQHPATEKAPPGRAGTTAGFAEGGPAPAVPGGVGPR